MPVLTNGAPFHLGGMASEQMYPEYWTDPNVAVCPSSAKAKVYGGGVIDNE